MARHFLDSSALLKRYRRETGSQWVLDLPKSSDGVIVARLAQVEVTAALVRRGRQPGVSLQSTLSALATLDADMSGEFEVLEFDDPIVSRAIALTRLHALRGADAIQLASALASRTLLPASSDLYFVSADDELNVAAAAEGLHVENPNLHP